MTRHCNDNNKDNDVHSIVSQSSVEQSQQIDLLKDALRCPQDIGSGARVCLECGRRFHDVFRLAQHIRDKHTHGTVQRGNEMDQRQGVILSDFVPFPPASASAASASASAVVVIEKKNKEKNKEKKEQKEQQHKEQQHKEQQHKEQQHKEQQHKEQRARRKKPSSLKKAYLKTRAAAVKESWSSVLASLDESIEVLEGMKREVKRRETVSDWNALEIAYQKGHILDEYVAELCSMKQVCRQRLEHVEKKNYYNYREGSNKAFLDVREYIHDRGNNDDTTYNVDDVIEKQTTEGDFLGSEVDNGMLIMYDSEDSISSDDSFDLQWGDTLQTWAQNMGHMNLKHLSFADDGSRYDDAKPIVVQDAEEEQASHAQDVTNAGTVRVISTYQKESTRVSPVNSHPDLALAEHVLPQEDDDKERDSPAWILDLSDLEKPTSCALCTVSFLGPDEWEVHRKSESHRTKVLYTAKRELQMKHAMKDVAVTKGGHLSTDPKKYTGPGANVEAYVSHSITEELNKKVSEFLSKLIAWQERSRRMDPMNAKKKKRLVCGMREAAKAVTLGKVKVLIVAPNVQPLPSNASEGKNPSYPVDSILQDCQKHNVPIIFALTRRKMGNLLGQRKNISLFAILNVSGAEDDLKALKSLLQNASY